MKKRTQKVEAPAATEAAATVSEPADPWTCDECLAPDLKRGFRGPGQRMRCWSCFFESGSKESASFVVRKAST